MAVTLERIFLTDARLRSIWKFFVSLPGLLLAFSATESVLPIVPLRAQFLSPYFGTFFLEKLLLLLALLGVFKTLTAFLDRRQLGSVGLAFHRRWARELGRGLVLGAAMILAVAAMEGLLGVAHFSVNSLPPARALSAGIFCCSVLALAAADEEMVFRGYPFQRLVEAITPVGGIAVTSALFGVAHLGNAHHTWISTANTALVGVPLAIAYLRTRSLWMPIGIHFMWNFLLGFLLGLPVSGFAFSGTLLIARVEGAAWLTGGAYGPEGSVLATMVIIGATIYLLGSRRVYVSEEMRELVFGTSGQPPGSTGRPSSAATTPRPDCRSDLG